jgi:hypothetical protein
LLCAQGRLVAIRVPGPDPRIKEGEVPGFDNLAREYEAKRFPAGRRLDLHGEGPAAARERALHWIQSHAHEEPGAELLLIVDRAPRPGRPASPVRVAVERLLGELQGKLIEWWQEFGPGSLALRIAQEPNMFPAAPPRVEPPDEGRTPETAGTALLALHHDIPDELMELARAAAELRRDREEISVQLLDVVLRRIWIEAQAAAMTERISTERALRRILAEERERSVGEE